MRKTRLFKPERLICLEKGIERHQEEGGEVNAQSLGGEVNRLGEERETISMEEKRLLEEIKSSDLSTVNRLAGDPETPTSILRTIFEFFKDDVSILESLGGNTSLPEDLFVPVVHEFLEELRKKENPWGMEAIINNPFVTREALKDLARGWILIIADWGDKKDFGPLEKIMEHRHGGGILEELADDQDEKVKKVVQELLGLLNQ